MPRIEEGLFDVLERILKADPERPWDCAELWEKPQVREHANSQNRVSDYLGHMWRKGQLVRLPAPKQDGSRARWMYQWKKQPKLRAVTPVPVPDYGTPNVIFHKAHMTIIEHGKRISIEFPNLIITLEQR